MKSRVIPLSNLYSAGKFRARFHIQAHKALKSSSYEMCPIGSLVTESKVARSPEEMGGDGFYYIGLENVESVTGEPYNLTKVGAGEVRSRSKIFQEGDILYGRLRPYLRKAFLVEQPCHHGLCSTEFIVLKPDSSRVLPAVLREILVSEQLTELISGMQAGAALPRVSGKDLLSLKVPVPPLEVQLKIEKRLRETRAERRRLLGELEKLTLGAQLAIAGLFD